MATGPNAFLMGALLSSLILLSAPGRAEAACTVTQTQPPNNSTQINSVAFKWNGGVDCAQYRVQFSPSGMYTPGNYTSTPYQTTKVYQLSETDWETNQLGAWAAGVYWRVQGKDAAGVLVTSTKRRILMDPDIDDDGASVTAGLDCDDNNPTIKPGALEVCNGVDEDCDGTADDGLPAIASYPDTDLDGYGDPTLGVMSCSVPLGFVLDGSDCDDQDDAIHPSATEVCDGIDNDCDGEVDPACVQLPLPGDLVITEIMQNPAMVGDSAGEWFEIHNVAPYDLDLTGVEVSDLGTDSFTLGSMILASGGYMVLGSSANMALNGGLLVNMAWSGFALGNSDDEIILTAADGTLLDEVLYDGGATFPDPTGASMTLDLTAYDDLLNDDGMYWCEATSLYGLGDMGTPGMENDSCDLPVDMDGDGSPAEDDCDDLNDTIYPGALEVCEDGIDQNCDGADEACGSPIPGVGDLIITEIMQNPAAVGDAAGEWFEVYNATATTLDLTGMIIKDLGTDSVTVGSLLIAPGDYMVFGSNPNLAVNGGVTVDYGYGGSLSLGNADDEVVLVAPGGTIIDQVNYDGGAAFPDPNGMSMTLGPTMIDAVMNDVGGNWCTGTSAYGLGDLGTPGAANDTCL